MGTGTAGLTTTTVKANTKKNTKVMKTLAMATCCQNQY